MTPGELMLGPTGHPGCIGVRVAGLGIGVLMKNDRTRRFGAWALMVALASLGLPGQAAAEWKFGDFRNVFGDTATAVLEPAKGDSGLALFIACDGDRWRRVALGPIPSATTKLSQKGEVRTAFSGGPVQAGRWKTRRRPDGVLIYDAPQPTDLARRLMRGGAADSDAIYRLGVITDKGKKLSLDFPLAGLAPLVRKHLWKPCKLANYFPEVP